MQFPCKLFLITELLLHNQESMFNFASHRRFPVFNLLVPVNAGITVWSLDTRWPAVDTEFDITEMFIIPDFIMPFNSKITGITVNDIIIFTYEIMRFLDVVDIGCCASNRMNVPCSGVNTGMYFHTVIPLVAFFNLMHLRITLLFLVFVEA